MPRVHHNTKTQDDQVKSMLKQIRELEATIDKLMRDPNYGILSGKTALEIELRSVEKDIRFLAYLDIDYLHDLNSKIPGGHEAVNEMIRRALHFRSSDIILPGTVLPGRWYSGDEIVILLSGDPAAFCERLKESFAREGMSISIAWVEYSGKLLKSAAAAKAIVDQMKRERGVGR